MYIVTETQSFNIAYQAAGTLKWNIGASVDFAIGAATAGLPKPPNYVCTFVRLYQSRLNYITITNIMIQAYVTY